jgi:hypothetical protein
MRCKWHSFLLPSHSFSNWKVKVIPGLLSVSVSMSVQGMWLLDSKRYYGQCGRRAVMVFNICCEPSLELICTSLHHNSDLRIAVWFCNSISYPSPSSRLRRSILRGISKARGSNPGPKTGHIDWYISCFSLVFPDKCCDRALKCDIPASFVIPLNSSFTVIQTWTLYRTQSSK